MQTWPNCETPVANGPNGMKKVLDLREGCGEANQMCDWQFMKSIFKLKPHNPVERGMWQLAAVCGSICFTSHSYFTPPSPSLFLSLCALAVSFVSGATNRKWTCSTSHKLNVLAFAGISARNQFDICSTWCGPSLSPLSAGNTCLSQGCGSLIEARPCCVLQKIPSRWLLNEDKLKEICVNDDKRRRERDEVGTEREGRGAFCTTNWRATWRFSGANNWIEFRACHKQKEPCNSCCLPLRWPFLLLLLLLLLP